MRFGSELLDALGKFQICSGDTWLTPMVKSTTAINRTCEGIDTLDERKKSFDAARLYSYDDCKSSLYFYDGREAMWWSNGREPISGYIMRSFKFGDDRQLPALSCHNSPSIRHQSPTSTTQQSWSEQSFLSQYTLTLNLCWRCQVDVATKVAEYCEDHSTPLPRELERHKKFTRENFLDHDKMVSSLEVHPKKPLSDIGSIVHLPRQR